MKTTTTLLTISILTLLVGISSAATLEVGAGMPYTTIQDAVNASSAGDTIFVWNGTYNENVHLKSDISIIGESSDVCTVKSVDPEDACFWLGCNKRNVTIQSFTVTGSTGTYISGSKGSGGVHLFEPHNVTVKDMNVTGNHFGIRTYGTGADHVDNITISGNTFSNNTYAVRNYYIWDSVIYNNIFNETGVSTSGSAHNLTFNVTKTPGTNIIGGPYLGGNYWWDYTGEDTPIWDTLGDTEVPHRGDYHPLTNNHSTFGLQTGETSWWNVDWRYRVSVNIAQTNFTNQTDYPVYVNLSGLNVNATSLRAITNGTESPHWSGNITDGIAEDVWISAASLPTGTWVNNTYWIYWGNDAVNTTSNGSATFTFCDDFDTDGVAGWSSESSGDPFAVTTSRNQTPPNASYTGFTSAQGGAYGNHSFTVSESNEYQVSFYSYHRDVGNGFYMRSWIDSTNIISDTWGSDRYFSHNMALSAGSHYIKIGCTLSEVYTNHAYFDDVIIRKDVDGDVFVVLGDVEENNATGSSVYGIVYYYDGSADIGVDGAIVRIYNSTWSASTYTVNDPVWGKGFYCFSRLPNDVYQITVTCDRFLDSPQNVVNTTNETTRKDLLIQRDSGQFYSRHYVTFKLLTFFGETFSDVTTDVHRNGNVVDSGTTGSDGKVVFAMYEDEYYTVTFTDATQGINESLSLYPRDNEYYIYITSFSWTPPENQTIRDTIDWWWESERINVTYGWINFTYTDSANETTSIQYWINDSDDVNLYSFNTTYPATWSVNQIVPTNNTTYIVHFSADHPRFESLVGSVRHTISFHGLRISFGWDEQWMYDVVAVCAIIFIGLLFCAKSAHIGAVICVLSAWMFMWMGWLSDSTVNYGIMMLATIVAVGFAMRKGEVVK